MPFACIFVPDFPAQAILRGEPALRPYALAVLEGTPPLETLAAMNEFARAMGVLMDMPRALLEQCSSLVLRRRGSGPLLPWRTWLVPALGSLLMAAAVLAVLHVWPAPEAARFAQRALHLGAAIAAGMAVYAAIGGPAWLRWRRMGRRTA